MSSSSTLPRLEGTDEALVRQHAPHVRYLHNPADDRGQRMDDAWFDQARDFEALGAHRRVHDFDVGEVIRRVRSAEGGSIDVG